MPAVDKCPDPGRWNELLDSRLPEPVASALSSHLEGCRGCQTTLDRLTAGEPTWAEAARAGEDRPRAALREAMEQLKATGEAGLDTAGPTTIRDVTLSFLRPPASSEHLGRLGSYDVLGLIGRGGMGVVLKAFDPALRRLVAIKVLAPQWASHAQARQRFEREAHAAARVRHENVVAIHAVDESDGLPYLVMEYVPGLSLQQRLDRDGPLEIEEILRIGSQAAAGLAAAHEKDLIHRDIKPANILLDKSGNVRLTDFGLARAVDDTSLTQTGVIAGTPQYMAPEQARGSPLDHRADLFSLGSVLYAMCTGRAPFRGPTTVAVLKRVCEDEPRDVRDRNPDVPDWLAEIIEKLHAKKPRDRFQSADEVARLLTRHLRHLRQPDKFAKPGPVDRPRVPTSWGLWAAVLAFPAAAVAGLLIWVVVAALGPKRVVEPALPTGQAPQVEGDPFFQKVWGDLHSNDSWARKTAVERLANMKPNDERQRATVAAKLVELSEDKDVFVRRPAVKALGYWGGEKELPALKRALAHEDVFTRHEALKVIGRFHDPRTLEAVIISFRDNSTRREAGQALRDLGPMAESAVLTLLSERDEGGGLFLKRDAIGVLADIGTEKSVPALQKVLATGNPSEKFHLAGPAQKALDAIEQRTKQ